MAAPRKFDEATVPGRDAWFADRMAKWGESALQARRQVGAMLDINPGTLRHWSDREDVEAGTRLGVTSEVAAELKALRWRRSASTRWRFGDLGWWSARIGLRGAAARPGVRRCSLESIAPYGATRPSTHHRYGVRQPGRHPTLPRRPGCRATDVDRAFWFGRLQPGHALVAASRRSIVISWLPGHEHGQLGDSLPRGGRGRTMMHA